MPIAEDSAGGSPVPIPTNLTTNLTGEATGSGTLDYTTGDIDIVVTVVDNGHNHILSNITDVQVNNAISGQVLKYNGNVWVNGTDENAGITAIVQDTSPALGGNLDLNNRNITGTGNLDYTGNITLTGTVDGRNVSADGTKLDGIESGATADQTAAQIKTAYESNSNTNAFTDADHTKLDGIETAADVTDTTNVVASLTAGTNVTIAADGTISATSGTSGIAHVVDDTTPELGGNLDLNSHDITGTGNLNFTGSVTLSGTVDGRDVAADGTKLDGIEASADVTDTANVTAAGALMDSEVTNLAQVKAFDSSDYATAAQGTTADAALPKAGGTMTGDILFNDGVKAKFGDSNDLQIWHNGTDSYVYDTGEGDLILRGSSNIKLQSAGGTALSTFTAAGASTLYFSAAEKLATSAVGVSVTGILDIFDNNSNISPDNSGSGQLKIDGNGYRAAIALDASGVNLYSTSATRPLIFGVNETEVARVTTTGIDVTGNVGLSSTQPTITLTDTDGPYSSYIAKNGSVLTVDGDSVRVRSTAGTEYMRVTSAGIDVTGNVDLPDNGKLLLGASDDLQIYHDASHSYIKDSGTGNLKLETTGGNISLLGGTENMVVATKDGSVSAYYDGNKKLETSASGIDVSGDIGISGAGTRRIDISNTTLADTGEMATLQWDNSANFTIQGRTSAGGFAANWYSIQTSDTDGRADAHIFYTDASTERMRIDAGGIDVTGKITVASTDPEIFLTDTSTSVTHSIDGNSGVGNLFMHVDKDETGSDPKFVVNVGSQDNVLVAKSTGVDVTGSTNTTGTQGTRQWSAGSAGQKLGIYAYDNSTFYHRLETGNATNYQWGTYDNIPIYTITNNSIKTTLLGNGNFGIGSTAPTAKLDVRGDVRIEATSGFAFMEMGGPSGAFIDLKSPFSDDYDLRVQQDGGQSKIRTTGTSVQVDTSSGYLKLGPQNTSYCHFDTDRDKYYFNKKLVVAGGSTGIVSSYNGNLLLQRQQSSSAEISIGLSQVVMTGQLNISGANPSSNNGAFEVPVINNSTPAIVSVSAGTTSLRTHHSFENSNGQVGKINTLGTQTFYVTSSDYRLKTDIQPMQGSIDRVKALKPCNFEWINDGGRVDGFIAHEAQEVVPEAIVGEKDAMRDKVNIITPLIEATYDEEGNELTSEIPAVTETEQVPDYQGIDQSKIVPLLTSALQDAIAKIEALETRLTALES